MRAETQAELGALTFGLGVRKFSFLRLDNSLSSTAFGHSGLGGSVAFADPDSGVTVAILVNKLTLDAVATQEILHLVCTELNIGTFVGVL